MKEICVQLSEISESREVMESKPYPALLYFIYILLSILIVTFMWMYFYEIDIEVKGTGMIRPSIGISTVNNKRTGKIQSVHLYEGKIVKKGDTLFIVEHEDLNATQELLEIELEQKMNEHENLKLLKESIKNCSNEFNSNNPKQVDYYYKYLDFEKDYINYKETLNFNLRSMDEYNEKYEDCLKLKESIVIGENLFSNKKKISSLKYTEYELRQVEIKQDYIASENQFNSNRILFESGAISKFDLDESEKQYNKSKLVLDQYEANYLYTLDSEIKELQQQIDQIKVEINKNKIENVIDSNNSPIQTQYIVNIDNNIGNTEKEIRSIKENLSRNRLEIEKCFIEAEADGAIKLKKKVSIGDYIGAGDVIATIIPNDNLEYVVQIMMPEKDLSSIDIGDKVRYHFYAMPYREYGAMDGSITSISYDSTQSEESGQNYYSLEANIEMKDMYSYKGEKASIRVGMMCEAQVITKSKKVLFFLLEKIDLWD